MQNQKSDNEFVMETISSWSYDRRVLTHAVMSIMLDFDDFNPVKELTKSVNYNTFAYDVVTGYLDGKNQTEAATDMMIADSALAHTLDMLRNWTYEHTPMESDIYFNMCSFFMMVPFLIAEMPEIEDDICHSLLESVEIDRNSQTFHSQKILECTLRLYDDSMKHLTKYVKSEFATRFYADAVDRLVPLCNFKSNINTRIKPFAYDFISKSPETYYHRKLAEMFRSLDAMAEPGDDDYIAIVWYLRNWVLKAAGYADAKKFDIATFILEAVMYETMRFTVGGRLQFRQRLLTYEEYTKAVKEIMAVAGDIFLSTLECMDIGYVLDVSDKFSRVAGDFRVAFMGLVNAKTILQHCDEIISRSDFGNRH